MGRRRANARNLLVAESAAMQQVIEQVEELSRGDEPVLIEGEPGTGRELIARIIHLASSRRNRELVPVSAGAAPKLIFVDEIQDGESNAFRAADGGTLLVKNLSELTRTSQRKLRRLLEARSKPGELDYDVRIVCSCDSDLEAAVANEMFNRPLFDLLIANRIAIPPLRERAEDIPAMARKMVCEYGRALGKKKLTVSTRAYERMVTYPWPGNVAELKQLCRRLVFRARGTLIEAADVDALLPPIAARVPLEEMSFEEMVRSQISAFLRRVDGYPLEDVYNHVVGRVERPLLELIMERTGGNQVRAAEILGMGRNTLRRKLTEHNLLEGRAVKRTRSVSKTRPIAARRSGKRES
jgi:two-component system nitrogen regulation response regulator GlnG